MKYVAFIPARGGSKGIPEKNIKQIQGKPLIAWSIEHALQCPEIDDVYVSTDCSEIRQVALGFGAKSPFLRPVEISGDTATTESAVFHFMEWMKSQGMYNVKNIILIQATSPVRNVDSLSRAIKQFEIDDLDSLVTVCKTHKFFWKNSASPQPSYDIFQRPRRQDIKPEDETYFENGSFYITRKVIYEHKKNRLGGKIGMFEMTAEESFEIDEPIDFIICEEILKSLERGK